MTPGFALLGSSTGLAVGTLTAFAAEITNVDFGPWVQGGSATLAVGALAYIAKLFAQGKLVARDSAEAEKKLAETNAELVDIIKASTLREDRLFDVLIREHGNDRHAL